MGVNHHVITYGPEHVDSVVRFHDGEATIRTIAEQIRRHFDDHAQIVHIILRTTNEQPLDHACRLLPADLHDIRVRLNAVLGEDATVCVRPNGNLEAVRGTRNTLLPLDVYEKIGSYCSSLRTNPDSAFDVSEQFWKDHLHGSKATIAERTRKAGGHLSPDETLAGLDGRSAEFLVQHVLERYLAPPADPRDTQARLVHRRHGIRFPEGREQTDATYHLHFRTLYNCELNMRQKAGCVTSRRYQFSHQAKTLTEFDALATTGLNPNRLDDYTTLLVFDPTTHHQLREKVANKDRKMRPFIQDMKQRGIDVHVFHALLHQDGRDVSLDDLQLPSNTHLIKLPLLQLVDRVARKTAKDLCMKVPPR